MRERKPRGVQMSWCAFGGALRRVQEAVALTDDYAGGAARAIIRTRVGLQTDCRELRWRRRSRAAELELGVRRARTPPAVKPFGVPGRLIARQRELQIFI